MQNQLKVQKIKNGYVIDENTYNKLCKDLLTTKAKIVFLKLGFIAIEDQNCDKENPYYGMDEVLEDVANNCQNIYENIDYILEN